MNLIMWLATIGLPMTHLILSTISLVRFPSSLKTQLLMSPIILTYHGKKKSTSCMHMIV